MPIIRNPFRKTPADHYVGENALPISPGLARTGSRSSYSKPLSIRANGQEEPKEYQLCEISDSGVFIPPSPPETKSFWSSRSGTSTRSSSHRSVLNENEPFNISRESFDSYRRSFDISARSPVIEATPPRGRQSLDARQMRLPSAQSLNASPQHLQKSTSLGGPLSAQAPETMLRRPPINPWHQKQLVTLTDKHINPPTAQPDESEDAQREALEKEDDAEPPAQSQPAGNFEDVKFDDDAAISPRTKTRPQPNPASPQFPQLHNTAAKKPSIFSRFTSSSSTDASSAGGSNADVSAGRPGSSGLGISNGSSSHNFFGRKRGASGQGAELGSMHGKDPSVSSPTAPQEVKTDA